MKRLFYIALLAATTLAMGACGFKRGHHQVHQAPQAVHYGK
ncbi:MAG: hypothetical protein WD342_08420 [Verrucomicrobiales bacterium]